MIDIIKLDLFPYDIMVAHKEKPESIKKRLLKYGVELDAQQDEYLVNSCLASTIKLNNKAVLIYFKQDKKPHSGLIAHEVFHAICMILAVMGVDFSADSEEVWAYMLENLTLRVERLLN